MKKVSIYDEMQGAESLADKMRLHRAAIEFTLAVSLADVINTLMMDAESDIKKADKTLALRHEDKQNMSQLMRFIKLAKTQAAKCSILMYKDRNVGAAVEDSDFIYSLLLTIIDKSEGEKKITDSILNKIKKGYKSKLPFLIRDIM